MRARSLSIVFILTLTPTLADPMADRVADEQPFYSADCMFLKSHSEPCIFASDIRPEVCITTFCSGDADIQKEIRERATEFGETSEGVVMLRQLSAEIQKHAPSHANDPDTSGSPVDDD